MLGEELGHEEIAVTPEQIRQRLKRHGHGFSACQSLSYHSLSSSLETLRYVRSIRWRNFTLKAASNLIPNKPLAV